MWQRRHCGDEAESISPGRKQVAPFFVRELLKTMRKKSGHVLRGCRADEAALLDVLSL